MNKLQHLQYLGRLGNQGKVAITDSDAKTYIFAVETADNQSLEFGVKVAIQDFIVGAKADGIWDAIKSSAILAGARTLSGALVPLKGTAPTNFNFVTGDYNRKTGLVGNGSTKYLDSNRNNNADPQNSKHVLAYVTQQQSNLAVFMGTAVSLNVSGDCYMYTEPNRTTARLNTSVVGLPLDVAVGVVNGLAGLSRSQSSNFSARFNGVGYTSLADASQTPINENIHIFKGGSLYANPRLAFYSIGEAIDLALLDTRVTQLMTDLGNAIP